MWRGIPYSTNFPGTSGGAQPVYGGVLDAFVSLLSADLKHLVQSTYLGGNGSDYAYSIAVSGGNVYVAGIPIQPIFPVPAEVLSLDIGGGLTMPLCLF